MIRTARLRMRCIGILLTGVLIVFLSGRSHGQTPPKDYLEPLPEVGLGEGPRAKNVRHGWPGDGDSKKGLAPSHPNKALGLPSFRVNDGIVTPFESSGHLVAWSSDYRAFFTAHRSLIQRIRFPELIEEYRLEATPGIESMAVSSAGLLYRTKGALLVLDEKTLNHVRTIEVPGKGPMTAVPRSPIALVQTEGRLAIVDTATGMILGNRTAEEWRTSSPANEKLSLVRHDTAPMGLYMSPDGAHAFTTAPFSVLSITGGDLVVTGQGKSSYGAFLSSSGDSRYVAMGTPDGESAVYRVSDPSKEVRSFFNKDWLSFDPAAGVLYTFKKVPGDRSQSVVILGKRGGRIKSYKLENRILENGKEKIEWSFPDLKGVLVHPGGRSLLLFTHGAACWFQYPPLDGQHPPASPDWLDSTETFAAELAATASNKPLLGTPSSLDGLTVTPVMLPPSDISSRPVWAADYRSFFTVSDEGTVRKISFPAMVEQRTLDLQTIKAKLAISSEGLVVMAPRLNTALILDADSLAVKKTIKECHDMFVASSPASKLIYATDRIGSNTMGIYDTEKGTLISKVNIPEIYANKVDRLPRLHGPDGDTIPSMNLALSPNGKDLFTGRSSVHRSKAGPTLAFEEIGKPMMDAITSIWVSPDSEEVAACGYSKTYIFSLWDLSQPAVTIPVPDVSEVAFDKKSKDLYLVVSGSLFRLSMDGTQKRSINLKQTINGLLAYPGGHNFLAWGQADGLLWLQVPKESK